MNPEELWEMIRKIRLTIGFTASLFGEAVGVSRATVTAWESARWMPNEEHIQRIAVLAPTRQTYPDLIQRDQKRMADRLRVAKQAENIKNHRLIVEKGRK